MTPAPYESCTNTATLIYRMKQQIGVSSDYALAKALNVSKTTVSHWVNDGANPSPEACHKIAGLLGIEFGAVLVLIAEDRASTLEEREAWKAIARKLQVFA